MQAPSTQQADQRRKADEAKRAAVAELYSESGGLFVLRAIILSLICVWSFCTRLFSVIRFESMIHEFDPQFNFRTTKFLVQEGTYEFLNYFDRTSWYPMGRWVSQTVYPGLMATAGFLHWVANSLHFTIDIRNVCVFTAPLFSAFTSIAVFLLTRDTMGKKEGNRAGLVAAFLMAVMPGYISRSVAGSYDNEAVAIFALIFCFWVWIRAVDTGSMMWAAACALAYFYMVAAWGGYVFIINLVPLHVLLLLLGGRFSDRLYIAYSTFYVIGTILSMQIGFVGFGPVQGGDHLPAMGVFGLLQIVVFVNWLRSMLDAKTFKNLIRISLIVLAGLGVLFMLVSSVMFTGRLQALLNPTGKKLAIISSVSEHQPIMWGTYFFDTYLMVGLVPAGMWILFEHVTDAKVFVLLYSAAILYFSSSMVRLVLVFAPLCCVVAGIALSRLLTVYTGVMQGTSYVMPLRRRRRRLHRIARRLIRRQEDLGVIDSKLREGEKIQAVLSCSREFGAEFKAVEAAYERAKKAGVNGGLGKEEFWETAGARPLGTVVVFAMVMLMASYVLHCTWVTSNAYSSPSVVMMANNPDGSRVIFDDYREAYSWIRFNTRDNDKIASWWDYGYQLGEMSNRTTIVDNNTRNNTQIGTIGKMMASTEQNAWPILKKYDVDYVLVVFGGMIGYQSDDIAKFLWMVRISGGIYPEIDEADYMGAGVYRVDGLVSDTMKNSVMYKLCYYKFGEVYTAGGQPPGYDRVRNCEIGHKNFELEVFEEAFTSSHWMIRVYRVKKDPNRASKMQ